VGRGRTLVHKAGKKKRLLGEPREKSLWGVSGDERQNGLESRWEKAKGGKGKLEREKNRGVRGKEKFREGQDVGEKKRRRQYKKRGRGLT